MTEPARALPPDDPLRESLHNEVHARPPARIRLPAIVTSVAVLNEGIGRAEEWAHLRQLPGLEALQAEELAGNFLRRKLGGADSAVPPFTLKWERHTEFTSYSLVQAQGADDEALAVPAAWLAGVPGRTVAAIRLHMQAGPLDDPHAALAQARTRFGEGSVVASLLGHGHSCAVTDMRLQPDGFERIVVQAPPDTSPTRAGRISQRLLELETYRLMALRGLPAAKALGPMLAQAEGELAGITAELEARSQAGASDDALLGQLSALAARVERATAEHGYRFAATRAYDAIVQQRLHELRERPIPGTQTLGEFLQRRLAPAMATVDSTAQRLGSLSQRIERALALLRTRVDIATEAQNQQLLEKLTRGQELQLKLQSTVEGLSIAAISYYVVSLVLYGAKAAKAAGLGLNPEVVAGASIPVVLWAVWRTVRHIHQRLSHPGH